MTLFEMSIINWLLLTAGVRLKPMIWRNIDSLYYLFRFVSFHYIVLLVLQTDVRDLNGLKNVNNNQLDLTEVDHKTL